MKSSLRPIAIVIYMSLFFVWVPFFYIALIDRFCWGLEDPGFFITSLSSFVYFIVVYIWVCFFKISFVLIDKDSKKIIFRRLFLPWRSEIFNLENIVFCSSYRHHQFLMGGRLFSLNLRIKSIKIKTCSGTIHCFTNFETKNWIDIEEFLLQECVLVDSKKFNPINGEEKEKFLKDNYLKIFEIITSVRWQVFIILVAFIIFSFFIMYNEYGTPLNWKVLVVQIVAVLLVVRELISLHKLVKKLRAKGKEIGYLGHLG